MTNGSLNVLSRAVTRHVLPGTVVSIYYLVRDHCYLSPWARVQLTKNISFGKSTVVKPFAVIQTQAGRISMGKNCAVSSFNHISTGIADVLIGDCVRMAPSVTILGGSRNFRKKDQLIMEQGSSQLGIIIESDVLIGAGSVILPGCKIYRGAVVGAGSVVNTDIPKYAIVAGAPARIIGYRE